MELDAEAVRQREAAKEAEKQQALADVAELQRLDNLARKDTAGDDRIHVKFIDTSSKYGHARFQNPPTSAGSADAAAASDDNAGPDPQVPVRSRGTISVSFTPRPFATPRSEYERMSERKQKNRKKGKKRRRRSRRRRGRRR